MYNSFKLGSPQVCQRTCIQRLEGIDDVLHNCAQTFRARRSDDQNVFQNLLKIDHRTALVSKAVDKPSGGLSWAFLTLKFA